MNYKELVDSINKHEIKNIYLFLGEEVYLINKALEKLKKILIDPSFEQLNFTILEGKEISISQIIDACETLPFMAEKKLVYVKSGDIFQSKSKIFSEEDEKYFIEYIKQIPETTTIVFYGAQSVDTRKKIVKEIKKYGHIVDFTKLAEEELNKWIKKKFKGCSKSIGAKETALLKNHLDYLGRNASQGLLDIENEINKIIAFMGEKTEVEDIHIEKVLSSNFQNDIFKLLDSIEKRNTKESIKRLNFILEDGEPVLKILTTLGNQLKNILSAKLLLEQGYTSKMIASKIGIHPFVASKCASQSKNFSVDLLKKLLNNFLEMDVMIKTGKIDEKIGIEMLVIEMCR